jgi:DNA-directed RNA polymerase subunit M/transcription elongation factor TFIIS
MEFCPDCKNYLFLKTKSKGENGIDVINQCSNCNYMQVVDMKSRKSTCLYENNYNIDILQYLVRKKNLLKYDPTIPHIDFISCINKECPSKTGGVKNDIFYVSLDNKKLYNLYVCNNCMVHWTNK